MKLSQAYLKQWKENCFIYIMTPAMVLSWFFGLILIHEIGFDQLTKFVASIKAYFSNYY